MSNICKNCFLYKPKELVSNTYKKYKSLDKDNFTQKQEVLRKFFVKYYLYTQIPNRTNQEDFLCNISINDKLKLANFNSLATCPCWLIITMSIS